MSCLSNVISQEKIIIQENAIKYYACMSSPFRLNWWSLSIPLLQMNCIDSSVKTCAGNLHHDKRTGDVPHNLPWSHLHALRPYFVPYQWMKFQWSQHPFLWQPRRFCCRHQVCGVDTHSQGPCQVCLTHEGCQNINNANINFKFAKSMKVKYAVLLQLHELQFPYLSLDPEINVDAVVHDQ